MKKHEERRGGAGEGEGGGTERENSSSVRGGGEGLKRYLVRMWQEKPRRRSWSFLMMTRRQTMAMKAEKALWRACGTA